MLNVTLTLMLVLHARYNDIFHCLHEGKFLVSLRRAKVTPALPGHSFHLLLAHLKFIFIQLCLIVELLVSYWDRQPVSKLNGNMLYVYG